MNKLAFIGGSGIYDPKILEKTEQKKIETPYGISYYTSGIYKNKEIIFMARHGNKHTGPPHKINYRANIYALKILGVTTIISTSAVGSLTLKYKLGDFILINQFIDMTKMRENTFFDGILHGVAHVDMTEPYSPEIRKLILKEANKLNITIHNGGTYICTEGPRFETPAEIKMFKKFGGTVVGMTNVPECQLAREAGIAYVTICMITNFAAGISKNIITQDEVFECMKKNSIKFQNILKNIADIYIENPEKFTNKNIPRAEVIKV